MGLILPEHYDPRLSVRETQEAIKYIRDTFQKEFGKEMNLERISAPLFVEKSSGLNDDLNGVERPVQFDIAGVPGETIEVVHSLAKWKRMALYKYGFQPGEGLYTNMNAIRRDEELDNLHSCYVDQWDWEKVIKKEERTVETLEATVRNIFKIIKHMEHEVWYKYPQAVKKLPEDIYFITSQELEDMYPDKTPKERENLITKEHGCVFLMKIGDKLASGEPHDGRAPDYDDWQLNGDILFWFETLNCALEISSMGIRVDEKALEEQLLKAGCEERKNLPYHKMLLNGELPYTIGGGIGQSRLCMLLLDRAHVGEVQASLWPEEMRRLAESIILFCCKLVLNSTGWWIPTERQPVNKLIPKLVDKIFSSVYNRTIDCHKNDKGKTGGTPTMMRGINTTVRRLRRKVFEEVAALGFKADADTLCDDMEAIPYALVNDETEQYRDSVYRARAVVREQVRLAMGLALRPEDKPVHLTAGVEASNISDKYYEPPLMQVIRLHV